MNCTNEDGRDWTAEKVRVHAVIHSFQELSHKDHLFGNKSESYALEMKILFNKAYTHTDTHINGYTYIL